MRRSAHVVAPLLASAAVALLTGCRSQEMQRCVDENNRIVDPSLCKTPSAPRAHGYHFYYGGSGGYVPGSYVRGGSAYPLSGHSYSTTSGTSRGGFGSSFGGEGGEGGGHGGGSGE
jgi:hypothetical protein